MSTLDGENLNDILDNLDKSSVCPSYNNNGKPNIIENPSSDTEACNLNNMEENVVSNDGDTSASDLALNTKKEPP